MKKEFTHIERKGLPGGPNEMFTYVTGVFSMEGYKRNSPDVNNPFNIIPSGNITMKDVDFPVMGTDNLGNSEMMMPGNDYQFPGDQVFEVPMAKKGGGLLTKTMKCNSCGWSWKAADGGKDVSTCHKCGGSALPKAQDGEELPTVMTPEMTVQAFPNATPTQKAALSTKSGNPIYRNVKSQLMNNKQAGTFGEETQKATELALSPLFKILPELAAEATMLPSVYRVGKQIKNKGAMSVLKDVGTTLESVIMGSTPFSNSIPSPNQDWSGAGTTMDVLGSIPLVAGVTKTGVTGVRGLINTLDLTGAGRLALNSSKFVPKKLPGSPNNFKSKINWGKWNKEIPENKALMQEYNAIEQQTKADGTWMQNPDGSEFLGTPELFIQSQSKNWVDAYGAKGIDNINVTYRGTSSGKLINNPKYTGVFTGDKNLAKGYAGRNPKVLTPESKGPLGYFKLGSKKSDKSISFDANSDDWGDLMFATKNKENYGAFVDEQTAFLENMKSNLRKKISEQSTSTPVQGNNPIYLTKEQKIANIDKQIARYKKQLENLNKSSKNENFLEMAEYFKNKNSVSTDDLANYLEKKGLDNIEIKNIIDGDLGDIRIVNHKKGNYLKSLIGNNGMFDMTNPNIYKSVTGAVGAVGGSQYFSNPQELTEFQDGGPLPKAQVGNGEYTVESGNTFDGIANKLGINKQALRQVNPGIDYNDIKVDQVINVPDIKTKEERMQFFSDRRNTPMDTKDSPGISKIQTAISNGSTKQENLSYNKDILKELSKQQAERRQSLLNAANTVASVQGNNKDLEKLLVMSAVMENTLGIDDDAYGRNYTRGPMSIDNIAYKDLFEIRKGATKYTTQQKKNTAWLESLGINTSDIDSALRSDDPLTSMAVARLVYGRAPEALPSGDDPDALYNYYLKYYNKTGVDKYGGAEAHRDRFNDYYNEIYKELGGEVDEFQIYANYINGSYNGTEMETKAEKIYDKLNRVYYRKAKALDMSAPNYIMSNIINRSGQ